MNLCCKSSNHFLQIDPTIPTCGILNKIGPKSIIKIIYLFIYLFILYHNFLRVMGNNKSYAHFEEGEESGSVNFTFKTNINIFYYKKSQI